MAARHGRFELKCEKGDLKFSHDVPRSLVTEADPRSAPLPVTRRNSRVPFNLSWRNTNQLRVQLLIPNVQLANGQDTLEPNALAPYCG
jgi:hypothetical protein